MVHLIFTTINAMKAFETYTQAKNSISKKCDSVERAWHIASKTSDFEQLSGASDVDELSEVDDLLRQARLRLASDTIEVGIFGEVKRGKSTLINALVGQRVSSMRVTPETAVPVWVEHGKQKTVVIYSDGSSGEVTDTHMAQEMATQRAESGIGKNVVRVVQYTEVPWLPEGLRIVDTPGLQDPSLADSYESRTMDELERVSAAVFMFVSPPGPASHEVQVLRRMAAHGIDKVFLVCNFYPGIWNNESERDEVLSYIRKVVIDAAIASSSSSPRDIKLYAVNARDGLAAIESNDFEAYSKSGLAGLRDDIEDYLVNGALKVATSGSEERLQLAAEMVRRTLDQRETILRNPNRITSAIRELSTAVESSSTELKAIEERLNREGEKLGQQIGEILMSPYEKTLELVAASSSITELKIALAGLENLASGAQARAATQFERGTSQLIRDAETRLLDSFGSTESFAGISRGHNSSPHLAAPSVGSVTTRINWSEVMAAGALSGIGSAAIGGTLAGGAGLALLATGPVGWVIGAAAIGIIGLLGGSAVGIVKGISKVSAEDRKRISGDLSRMIRDAREYGISQGSAWGTSASSQLRAQRDRYLGDKQKELDRVTKVLEDKTSQARALKEIVSAREIIKEI